MYLNRVWSVNQLLDYHYYYYCNVILALSLSHPRIFDRRAYTHSCSLSVTSIHCHQASIEHVTSPACIHTCHAEGINAVQTRVTAGMAYTVGYIVHGPSQLASAV